ncbi:hypothetical protein STCU_02413 [Strigomonas culicis]|uniref:Uncharacterized protein n=1 Tax=Strigomonas culicis TaxID=28005 RepID=S9WB67_9TRYP|nr:hypothetical protein STCU_02413 [Strigomonas culicis]|eukprot:EPY33215.1 hypothetical protein STCU_02413 [Strigomonas culicis]
MSARFHFLRQCSCCYHHCGGSATADYSFLVVSTKATLSTGKRAIPHNSSNRRNPICTGDIASNSMRTICGSAKEADSSTPSISVVVKVVVRRPTGVERHSAEERGMSDGSMREAWAALLMWSRAYMERGIGALPKTRRPNMMLLLGG